MVSSVQKVEFIGGPKHGHKLMVPNIDNIIRLPIYEEVKLATENEEYVSSYLPIAIYQRNIFMPEFFNYQYTEHEYNERIKTNETSELDGLVDGMEPPD